MGRRHPGLADAPRRAPLLIVAVVIAASGSIYAERSNAGSLDGRVVRIANLSVRVPAGWTSAREVGGFRGCRHAAARLWVASYRLPRWFGRHEGRIIVPPGEVLVGFSSLPIKSRSTLWKRWRVSNRMLRPAVAVGGSRYKAEFSFPPTPAVRGTVWAGDRRLSRPMLRVTNRMLASVAVNRSYGCR